MRKLWVYNFCFNPPPPQKKENKLAIENYINKLEGGRKRKVPSDELICRIHGL